MIVVQFRVVILHRVPISTHSHFFNPLYSLKPLQILQILQILQSYRHLTNVQAAQGPRYFFVHLARVAASLHSAGAGKPCGGRPRLCVFRRFCLEKLKFLGQKKIVRNPLAHSVPRPDQFYGLEPCEIAGRKWGAASPRSCTPLIPIPTKGHVSRLALLFLVVSSNVQQANGLPEVLHRCGQGFHSIVKRDDD